MEKNYNPRAIEKHWYQTWEDKNYFSPTLNADDNFCIMIPPPNVTGSLHMGHAFQDTIMDALTRYNRMLGKNTLWQAGTDHAGIATQMVVERLLGTEGKTRHDLGRDAFIDKIWQWKEQSGNTITNQLRRMGCSLDWENERFTMDDGYYRAVISAFVQLYEKGLIYRGHRLVNWDPATQSAISNEEVEYREVQGYLWYFRYHIKDSDEYVVVATTRPETMLGDSAVAINPNDKRFSHLKGKTIILPLVGREIPVIEDNYVDPEFGTGALKITPAFLIAFLSPSTPFLFPQETSTLFPSLSKTTQLGTYPHFFPVKTSKFIFSSWTCLIFVSNFPGPAREIKKLVSVFN